MQLISGTRLGRYEIRSKIGEGGMGEVYRARDEKLNRDVAVKVLPAALSENADRLRRFEQEAQAAGALNHPNILVVYDVGTHESAPYVVSELLEGETLRELINDSPLSSRKAIDYATQIAHGLAAAHEKGIVHRDLKPDNVFITRNDRVKILDFGVAKLVQPAGEEVAQTDIATRKVHTDPGTVLGTAGYMSPEQVRGRPYQSGNPTSQLTWFDRTGKQLGTVGEPDNYVHVALSPDQGHAAVEMLDADGRNGDVWLFDLARGISSRLTFDPQWDFGPQWSSDGTRILFSSNRSGSGAVNLYEKLASGAGDDQLLLESGSAKFVLSWSRNGQFALYENYDYSISRMKVGLWFVPLSGDRQPKPYLQSNSFDQIEGQFSPDGRWVAYASNESGRYEIYLQSFPASSTKTQISTSGGFWPEWRADGKELFYISADKKLMAVNIKVSNVVEGSVPTVLFPMNAKASNGYSYAVAADGQRFLINRLVEGNNPALITVVLNWTSDLKRQR